MMNKDLDDITKTAYKNICIVWFFASIVYCVLYAFRLLREFGGYSCTVIVATAVLNLIFCGLATAKPKMRIPAIWLLVLTTSVVTVFPNLHFGMIFCIPVFMSLYTLRVSFIKRVVVVSVILRTLALIIKEFHMQLLEYTGTVPRTVAMIACIVMMNIVELGFLLSVFIPIFKYLMHLKRHQEQTIAEKQKATEDLLAFCSTATSYHNQYLSVHIKGVKEITEILLNELVKQGKITSRCYYNQILFSVQFHDLGKIYIDPGVLDKPSKLSDIEFDLVKEHPQRGYDLFKLIPKNVLEEDWMVVCGNIILQHHERLDGTGYPNKLKGDEISFEAQIVAVADVVDALLSWRPYKKPFAFEKMADIIFHDSGLNNELVEIVLQQRDKILQVSNQNNKLLQGLLKLDDSAIVRA